MTNKLQSRLSNTGPYLTVLPHKPGCVHQLIQRSCIVKFQNSHLKHDSLQILPMVELEVQKIKVMKLNIHNQ